MTPGSIHGGRSTTAERAARHGSRPHDGPAVTGRGVAIAWRPPPAAALHAGELRRRHRRHSRLPPLAVAVVLRIARDGMKRCGELARRRYGRTTFCPSAPPVIRSGCASSRPLNLRVLGVNTQTSSDHRAVSISLETQGFPISRGDPGRAFPNEAAPSRNARENRWSLPVPLPVPDLVRRGCGAGAIGISA